VKRRVRLATVPLVLTAALFGAPSALAVDPTLYVHYTMNCTFTLTGDNGAPITSVPPGRYQVLVSSPQGFAEVDLSGVADPFYACGGHLSFHLTGPGVNLHTTLEEGDGSGDQMQANLQAGTYVAFDDKRSTTRTSFTVSSGAASTGSTGSTSGSGSTGSTSGSGSTATSGTKAVATLGTLNGGVDTKGKLTLTFKGKRVGSVKTGRYKVTVLDETSSSGFSLQKAGGKATAITSKPYVGRKTVTLTLKPGQWTFFSPTGKKTAFVVVA
jgi:hypothetical protein